MAGNEIARKSKELSVEILVLRYNMSKRCTLKRHIDASGAIGRPMQSPRD